MHSLRALLFACAAILALPVRAETLEIPFEMDGLERSFILTVPDTLAGPAPLVLATHGLLETGQKMRERITQGRFDTLARRYGFVVAYPTAVLRVWNLGEGIGAERIVPSRDDVAYLERVIEIVRARVEIDPDRIFAAGFSQGGMMSFALACKRPGLVRAVASVAMPLPLLLADDCARHPPRGVSLIHGTNDRVVPMEGGQILSGPMVEMALLGHDESLAFFRRQLGCAGPGESRIWDARNDATMVTRRAWYDCRRGAVEGYVVEGMGHRWPGGGWTALEKPFTGRTTGEIEGAAAIWGFFSRFQ